MTVFSKKVWHIDITGMKHHFMSLMVADIKSIALFTVENSFLAIVATTEVDFSCSIIERILP